MFSCFVLFCIHCYSQLEDTKQFLLNQALLEKKKKEKTHTYQKFESIGEGTLLVVPLSLEAGGEGKKVRTSTHLKQTAHQSQLQYLRRNHSSPPPTTGEKPFYKQLNELNSQI